MLMIVAHHYIVCSGLTGEGGPLSEGTMTANSLFLRLFGMWGKVGINCFLMITGYFMCKSLITVRKWVKLFLEVYFYKLFISSIFFVSGAASLSLKSIVDTLLPIHSLHRNFTDCFLVFYLTIPFWNILIRNMTDRQHKLLLLLLLFFYTCLGSVPMFTIEFNYITWFGIIYLIASYIRLHPIPLFNKDSLWGAITLVLVILSLGSVTFIHWKTFAGYFFVSDCNKVLAVLVAVSSFLWFKNLNVPQSKIINAIGASTFGVLLIQSNSGYMMKWLWGDMFDVVGHFSLPLVELIFYSVTVVLVVFFVCNILDQLRIQLLENPFFKWYDKHIDYKLNSIIRAE